MASNPAQKAAKSVTFSVSPHKKKSDQDGAKSRQKQSIGAGEKACSSQSTFSNDSRSLRPLQQRRLSAIVDGPIVGPEADKLHQYVKMNRETSDHIAKQRIRDLSPPSRAFFHMQSKDDDSEHADDESDCLDDHVQNIDTFDAYDSDAEDGYLASEDQLNAKTKMDEIRQRTVMYITVEEDSRDVGKRQRCCLPKHKIDRIIKMTNATAGKPQKQSPNKQASPSKTSKRPT